MSEEELKVYFTLIILMSLMQKPILQSYWTTDKSTETPYIRTVLSRNRFMSISRNLHFANNESLQPDDPLRKIDMITKALK
ncbi:PiggyBac transposable element-derived protein 4 [Anthophora plagiata]